MLKVMRDSFHHLKWILIAVVAAFVFGFVFLDMGLGGALGGRSGDMAYAARVNGETISYNDYYRSLKRMEDTYKQMYGEQFTPQLAEAMGLPKQVLEALIDQRLLMQEAERLNLEATPEEVRRQLLQIPTFSQDGKFIGMELYTRYVTGPLGFSSTAEFEEQLAREIVLQKIDSALRSSVVVSTQAAEDEYRRSVENSKIRYVLLPSTQVAASVTVTPAEVETYYKEHQADYTHPEQRTVKYLLADLTKIRPQMTPGEPELRKEYEANRERFRRPASARVLHILVKVPENAPPAVDAAAKAKADALVQQLRGGADFAALAKANSGDPGSAANGGDMGWVGMGETVEPFERAIFSIPLNSISDPIRSTEYGYHIVKVTERRDAGVRPFEEVRGELATAAGTEMAREASKAEITRLNAAIKAKKPATAEAFTALASGNVTSNDSSWFGRNDQIPGIGNNPALMDWAFAAKKGDVSEPIETPRGMAIAYLADSRPSGVSPLTEVRQQVEGEARQQKARDAARANLAQMVAGAPDIDTVATKAGSATREATVSRVAPVQGLTGNVGALVEAAMTARPGELKGPVIVDEGAVAFQVVDQKKVTPDELKQNRANFVERLRVDQMRNLRAALVGRLRKAAAIEVNDQLTRPARQPNRPAGV
jgi:peptidyl-prolyl cis-trans isomerase D